MNLRQKLYSKVCGHCYNSFTSFDKNAKYCSVSCANKQIGIERRRYIHCKNCGEIVWANGKENKYFCSIECMNEYKDKNRKYPKRRKPPHDGIYHKECVNCHKPFTTKTGQSKYCSDDCKREYENKKSRELAHNNYIPEMRICKNCQCVFFTSINRNRNSQFCSEECMKNYHKNLRVRVNKISEIMNITVKSIYKRDHGICQICNLPVNIKSKSKYWSASIDHIVPINEGGSAFEENCQLTHLI